MPEGAPIDESLFPKDPEQFRREWAKRLDLPDDATLKDIARVAKDMHNLWSDIAAQIENS